MDVLLKPFAVLATNWKFDQFFKARLKLALLYVLVVAVIIGGVSVFFYITASRQIENFPRRFVIQGQIIPGHMPTFVVSKEQQVIIDEVEAQIISNLLIVDLSILLAVFLLGFWWAGHTLRPIQESVEQQKRFIADASHELRTPLAVIQTTLDVFEQHPTHTKTAIEELHTTIREEVKYLSLMSTQLLDLSTADLVQSTKDPVNLESVMATIYKRFAPIAKEKDIELIVVPGVAVRLLGHEKSLEHAFSNLVDNALKYTPAKGIITLAVEKKETEAVVTVTDTGIGINKKDIPHIFNRFYQGDSSKHTIGTGLGLAIVKSIIEKHGGQIEVESESQKGTTFRILLPL